MDKTTVALIYDFDKTLSPRDMQEYGFIPGINMRPDEFWDKCREFTLEHQVDGILAYMYMMQHMARGNMELTESALNALGRQVEFFPGVEDWFGRINAIGDRLGARVEHYIISSGLAEIIAGSRIGREFKAIFASSYCYDASGRAMWPATAVNYTAKTQYLFRINKGILDVTNDQDLNAYTPEYKRPVPFSNMIYIGDGLTDVPCMKMTKQKGGYSIVVHAPGGTELPGDMLLQGRADFAAEADYGQGSVLESIVSDLIAEMVAAAKLSARHAGQVRDAYERAGGAVPPEIEMRGGLAGDDERE